MIHEWLFIQEGSMFNPAKSRAATTGEQILHMLCGLVLLSFYGCEQRIIMYHVYILHHALFVERGLQPTFAAISPNGIDITTSNFSYYPLSGQSCPPFQEQLSFL